MSGGRLVTFRHAKPSATGICYGRRDVETELSPEEAAQRVVLPPPLERVDLVWSSPSLRCHAPASSWASAHSIPHRVDDRLLELSFGHWEGRAWSEIHATYPETLRRWGERWQEEAPPGGETLAELEARVEGWMRAIDPGKRHLLIGHAGVIRALSVLTSSRDWAAEMATPVPHLEPRVFILG